MAKKIILSFKEHKDDDVFNYLLEKSNYSGFIKDLLREDMKSKRAIKKEETPRIKLIDF
jgi:hypothetical protein